MTFQLEQTRNKKLYILYVKKKIEPIKWVNINILKRNTTQHKQKEQQQQKNLAESL